MLEDIQANCLQTYKKNMLYFDEHFKELFSKISLFEKAIDLNQYSETWSLNYKEDNYFELENIKNDYNFYNTNTIEDAEKITKEFNFDESSSFNNLKKIEPPKNFKLEKNIMDSDIQYLYPLYTFANKYKTDEKYKKIEKFIFIGTGLGFHISSLVNKIKAKAYLIIEPNIEIFRLSLFTTDYTKLVEEPEDIFFSISETGLDFENTFDQFYSKYKLLNHWFKFHSLTKNYDYYYDLIANSLDKHDPLSFPFSILLKTVNRTIEKMSSNYSFISYDKEVLKDYPVCLVAPGPSLEAGGIEWLCKNQNKYLIISLGATLKKLEKYNIIPDIVVSVDPHEIVKNQFELQNKDIIKNSIFLCSSNTSPTIMEYFKKENTFIYPVVFNVGTPKEFALAGNSVGEVSYALSLLLGVQELYLFGTDLSFDSDTGASHSKEHIHYKRRELVKTDIKEKINISRNDIIQVEGNFLDEVYTSRIFYSSIKYYNKYTELFKKEQIVFNTTNGAKLEDIDCIKYEDIKIPTNELDKEKVSEELREKLKDSGKDSFTDEEKNSALKDLDMVNACIKNIKKYKKIKFKTYNKFQYDRLTLIIDNTTILKDLNNNFIIGCTNSYEDSADKILFDFFGKDNTIRENKNYINTMNKYWLDPYEKMFICFKELLEKIK